MMSHAWPSSQEQLLVFARAPGERREGGEFRYKTVLAHGLNACRGVVRRWVESEDDDLVLQRRISTWRAARER
jgi:hypothetical protein